jgi:hypothetical protein
MKLHIKTLWIATLCSALVHCGTDDSTGRTRVTFEVTAQGTNLEGDTSLGWHVRITQAAVAVGPLRWFEGQPLFGNRSFFSSSVAWAHPGHYVAGGALADMTTRHVVDLLAPQATSLGMADGVSGTVQSAHVELHPSETDLTANRELLRNGTISLRGIATRDDVSVVFTATQRLDMNLEGIPARAELNGSPGKFELRVQVLTWVDRVDFSMLPAPTAPGAEVTFPDEGQASNALFRGVTNGAAYNFQWRLENGSYTYNCIHFACTRRLWRRPRKLTRDGHCFGMG